MAGVVAVDGVVGVTGVEGVVSSSDVLPELIRIFLCAICVLLFITSTKTTTGFLPFPFSANFGSGVWQFQKIITIINTHKSKLVKNKDGRLNK